MLFCLIYYVLGLQSENNGSVGSPEIPIFNANGTGLGKSLGESTLSRLSLDDANSIIHPSVSSLLMCANCLMYCQFWHIVSIAGLILCRLMLQLFVSKEEKLSRWKKKLISMRRRKLEGEAM